MTATVEAKPWDFSHVLDLVNSLSFTADSPPVPIHSNKEIVTDEDVRTNGNHVKQSGNTHADHLVEQSNGLGDFSRLWQFLDVPANSPTPTFAVQAPKAQEVHTSSFQHIIDYASDGAVPSQISRKKAAAKKQVTLALHGESIADDQATDTLSDGSVAPDTPTLTKSQRKKRNRKLRKEDEAALAEERVDRKALASVSEPEADTPSRKTPAKKASTHAVATPPSHKYNLRQRDASGNAVCAPQPDAIRYAVKKLEAAKKANAENLKHQSLMKITKLPATADKQPADQRPVVATPLPNAGSSAAYDALHNRPKEQQPTHISGNITRFVPATVPPIPRPTQSSFSQQHTTPNSIAAASKHARVIQPMVIRSGEDRDWALLMKLIGDFYQDRKYLISPMNLTTHNNHPKGIHVFVDASNIFIGFNEQLKRSRGISFHAKVPEVNLSFDALALLMERRRPVAKRVLVGSTPHLPAFDKAKAVGYECNILEKVYKARELTERQIYFKELDRTTRYKNRHAKAPPANNVNLATLNGGSGSGSGSGSETNAAQYAPARMIEQGVDEILHLKILESIVDTDVPNTIVLATGDAAQAEYSEGFMAMVERALKKGWTVELVSWSKNISAMYTKRAWVEAWGERFKIITLDDYAEELLDM